MTKKLRVDMKAAKRNEKLKKYYKGPFPLRAWKKAFFVCLLIFFCARFNRRSIKETKNALFHARSGNGP